MNSTDLDTSGYRPTILSKQPTKLKSFYHIIAQENKQTILLSNKSINIVPTKR